MSLLKGNQGASRCAASRRFRRYDVETEDGSRRGADVRQDPVSRELVRLFSEFPHSTGNYSDNYNLAVDLLSGLRYTPADVRKFSVLLSGLISGPSDGEKAGWFLSAVMNSGSHRRYAIQAIPSDYPIGYLGFRNDRQMIVDGPVGYACGLQMKGGSIIINGDAGDSLGSSMDGGRITVRGRAGSHVGDMMSAGEIRLLGGYESISKDCRPDYGGRIFIGRKKAVDGYWYDEGAAYG